VGDLPDIRATDADRERTVTVLRTSVANGQLTVDELDERVEAAYAARTRGERYEASVAKAEDTRGSIERTIEEGQAKLREIAKAQMDEQKLAEAKGRLRGIFDKLKSRKDIQVAEARAELADLLGTAEGRAAVYDMAVIGQLAAAV